MKTNNITKRTISAVAALILSVNMLSTVSTAYDYNDEDASYQTIISELAYDRENIIMEKNINAVMSANQADFAKAVTAVTKSNAIKWINNCADTKWQKDVDGNYGCQCVDLVMGYYGYLGYRSYARGNGKDYAKNALPDGWKRIGFTSCTDVQAGDIIVWTAGASLGNGGRVDGTYGHVGLAAANGSAKGFTTVETRGGTSIYAKKYTRKGCSYIIRPLFKTSGVYKNALVDGASYRFVASANTSLALGSTSISSKSNVQLVNKKSALTLVAHYNSVNDAWYFTPKNSSVALNLFADHVVSNTNCNLYKFVKNDTTQEFLPVKKSGNKFVLLSAENPGVAIEGAGYASKFKAGTNVRGYSYNASKTDPSQIWILERV